MIMKYDKWMSRQPFLMAIYMMQPDGFITEGQEHMVCMLHKSIYGLKQASRSWNKRFDHVIKTFGFDQNDENLVYTERCRML